MCNELKITRHEWDKYKEEWDKYKKEHDELCKLAEYWKHKALEKTIH